MLFSPISRVASQREALLEDRKWRRLEVVDNAVGVAGVWHGGGSGGAAIVEWVLNRARERDLGLGVTNHALPLPASEEIHFDL